MKKFIVILLIGCFSWLNALEITSDFVIVTGKDAIRPELKSAEILSDYLGRIFGRKMMVISEDKYDGKTSAIFVGKGGVGEFGPEEHFIKVEGGNLIISGGRPRGALYGVYEFLERFGGCRKLAIDAEFVPEKDRIEVPDGETFRAQPFFMARRMFTLNDASPACSAMKSWYRMNVSTCYPPGGKDDLYLYYSLKMDGGGHTFYSYSKAIPDDKMECFSLLKGKRVRPVSNNGPGQFCLSSPEARRLIKAEMNRRVELNRRQAENGKEPLNSWYDLSTNDNKVGACECAPCKELEKKYGGTYTGALFDFINDIAADFPGEIIQTYGAYRITEKLPANIRLRDNIMLNLASQCTVYIEKSNDLLSPFEHPNNAELMQKLNRWFALGKVFAVYDYGRMFNQIVPTPYVMVHTLGSKFRYYAQHGVRSYSCEIEPVDLSGHISPPSFFDLQNYLTGKLMYDPELDVENTRQEYMRLYYGSAAGEMEKYYQNLLKSQQENPVPVPSVPVARRDYLNYEFFVQGEEILSAAEQAAEGDAALLARIGQERIAADFAYLYFYDKFGVKTADFPVTRDQVIDRLENNVNHAVAKYLGELASYPQVQKREAERIALLRRPIPIPEQFKNNSIFQYSVLSSTDHRTMVDDPEALWGKAFQMKKSPNSDKLPDSAYHSKPLEVGIYGEDTKNYYLKKVFAPGEYFQDEKYHLYYIGRIGVPPSNRLLMYFHWQWNLKLSSILRDAVGSTEPNRELDVYLSIKLEGPAYIKNSKRENSVSVDKAIFVLN